MVANNPISVKRRAKIKDLLDRLKNKLKAFAIINMQGQVLGRVKDLVLDKSYQLNVVMEREEPQTISPSTSHLLGSKYIEHVDAENHTIFVDLPVTEIQQLPVYPMAHNKVAEASVNSEHASLTQANTSNSSATGDFVDTHSLEMEAPSEGSNEAVDESDDTSNILEEEIVRLLEERLVVNRSKRKVGEVVVRKEIETRIVEVPIHREKLIVEQVGSETKTLAEIDLGQGEVTGVDLSKERSYDSYTGDITSPDTRYRVIGEFVSPKAVSNLLDAIALQRNHGCEKVRVELVVENPELRETYQKMFDRCSIRSEKG